MKSPEEFKKIIKQLPGISIFTKILKKDSELKMYDPLKKI